MLHAHDLMTRNPVSILETEHLHVAVEVLATLDIRHLPVVDASGDLVGMLSDRDLRSVASEARANLNPKVREVMTTTAVHVDTDADAAEVIDLMLDHKIGAVPVTDEDGSLVGIISYIDVLRSLQV